MSINELISEAETFEVSDRPDRAIELYRSALSLAESTREWTTVADINERLASLLRELGRFRLAIGHYHAAIAAYEKASPNAKTAEMAGVLFAIGTLLINRKREKGAESYLIKALEIAYDTLGAKHAHTKLIEDKLNQAQNSDHT
ncbi:MAG: tetratricopeptide repeat protein [bacterium]|nr:tetratricopeptide repeat protein [bacterium]